jgi:outer membrane protein
MKIVRILTLAVTLAAISHLGVLAQAPVKIGYVFVEAVIGNLPEFSGVQSGMQTHQQQLSKNLSIKQSYLQAKFEEYQASKQAGKLSQADDEAKQKELRQLDEEVRKFQEEAEQSMAKKREELLTPLYDKTQKAIDAVSKEEGYTYILNGGSSNILVGPPEHNITEKVAKKLGITIPKPGEAKPGDKPAAQTGTTTPGATAPAPKPAGAPK